MGQPAQLKSHKVLFTSPEFVSHVNGLQKLTSFYVGPSTGNHMTCLARIQPFVSHCFQRFDTDHFFVSYLLQFDAQHQHVCVAGHAYTGQL